MAGILEVTNRLTEGVVYLTEWLNHFPFKRIQVDSPGGVSAPLTLTIQEGGLFLHRFSVVSGPIPVPWDLQNYLVRMKIRKDDYTGAVQVDLSEGEGAVTGNAGIVNHGADGFFDLVMDAVATAAFDWDAAVYDLFLVNMTVAELAHGGGFTSLAVDVNDAGFGSITANGGTPFNSGVVAVGDLIRLSEAEDEKNNGVYTVSARTDTKLTFEKILGLGYGADNAADTAMKVEVLTVAEGNAIKLATGSVGLVRAVSQ